MIYLCSVYSLGANTDSLGDKCIRSRRTDYVRKRLAEFYAEGHVVVSPISHGHEISLNHNLPKDYKFWLDFDHDLIDASEEVWVLMMEDSCGSWKDSCGVTDEIAYAKMTGKKITYIECSDYH